MKNEKPNPAKEKSFQFALNIVRVCREIQNRENEYILSKQLLRSGTSIGAHNEEGIGSLVIKTFIINFLFLIRKQEKVTIGFDY